MGKTKDIVAEFPGLVVIHQKIPGREVGRHKHDEHEFFLPLQGEITVDYGAQSVKAAPGRMLYVPPDLDHSFSSSAQGSGERVIWLITPKLWKVHIPSKSDPCAFSVNTLAKELVFHLLIHPRTGGTKYFISALIESLGDSLNSVRVEKASFASELLAGRVSDSRIRRAIEFMNESPSSISIPEIARQNGLSSRNFNRLFLKETGLAPKEFLIGRRVEKAKKLLKETGMTVTDISLEVGYGSVSKFIGTFKKMTGVLPSDFRSGST